MTAETEIEEAYWLPKMPEAFNGIKPDLIRQTYLDLTKGQILVIRTHQGIPRILIMPNDNASMIRLTIQEHEYTTLKTLLKRSGYGLLYVPCEPERFCARFRLTQRAVNNDMNEAKKFEFTIKGPSDVEGARTEVNIPLSMALYSQNITEQVAGMQMRNAVVKERYKRPVEDMPELTWELDVFLGVLSPLVKMECERPNQNTPIPIPPIAWNALNITGDHRFDNAELAQCKKPPIR
jgi:CYTH domain-containing protein